ncbi:GAP family protein [Leifsonia aquatica]|uniref:GAP family protein n=1 Tax=Leifsonia aquatica TaxID=144185 RepID=UPI0035E40F43
MALIAVLVSSRARVGGIAFALGWLAGIALVLTVAFLVFGALQVRALREPPLWVPILRLVLGLLLVGAAVVVYRRGGRGSRRWQRCARRGMSRPRHRSCRAGCSRWRRSAPFARSSSGSGCSW